MRDLGSTDVPYLPALRGEPWPRSSWLIRVQARLRRTSLDAALACGADPCDVPVLAYRAARLTSERSRRTMAARVAEILSAARRPVRGLSVVVEPPRSEVAAAEPLLSHVQELLRSSAPVYARGVAMLECLLCDGGSALYRPIARAQLSRELELIIAALEGREQFELSALDLDSSGESN